MEILQEIIAIDKSAAARVEALRAEQAKSITSSGNAAAEDVRRTIAMETERLNALKAEQEKALADKKQSCSDRQTAEISRLDSVFAENREKWLNEMLGRITGV